MKRILSTFTLLLLLGIWVSFSKADSSTTTTMLNNAGAELVGYHIVTGTANLVVGTVTVTLSGKASFTSSTSYQCTVSDMTGINATSVTRNSGTSMTFNGLLTDTIGYICIGN